MMSHKYVYLFDEGNANMRELLGGKGANLAEMTRIGLPVPYGFTVSTEACTRYYEDGKVISDEIIEQIKAALAVAEAKVGKKFGSTENPYLVSVRSGARASMPGMMDTILNLGLNDETVVAMAKLTNNERFAYDSYRRFIQMFSDVVMEVEKSHFDEIFDGIKKKYNCKLDTELTAENLKEVVAAYKVMFKEIKGFDFPQDPMTQLLEAVKAVFRSWDNPRAIVYRRMNDIPASWGTAVNVQSMVFGNMGDDSGTGVAFTRNPATGEKKLFGEYLMNAQGEDVVAGIRTPESIDHLKQTNEEVYNEFVRVADILEKHYRDMQDMEFTIERGHLYMLQTRNGKRTAAAALQIAVDLVNEGARTKEEAVAMIEPKTLDALLHPTFDQAALKAATPFAKGLAASPGAACGMVYFSADEAKAAHEAGAKVILARKETSPEDIEGMTASEGILTAFGGMTSHAAVVARQLGTCCVSGCKSVIIDEKTKTITFENGTVLHEGDWMSLDGTTGNVYAQSIKTAPAELSGNFATIMQWADEIRTLKIRTNADSPAQAAIAVKFGAEGIGLCRTEHMFFDEARIPAMREMIVSKNVDERKAALAKILPMQREDFKGIYKAMEGRPVTIRFLDPPLHEFLPTKDEDIRSLAADMGITFEDLKKTVNSLHESNPMMGHRGCRLSITYPEIAAMQTRAVIEAAIEVRQETGLEIVPEIMIPLVGEVNELAYVKNVVDETAKLVMNEKGMEIPYMVGTMIEIPRAALTADEIAKQAEFFSFGTNDLTQMTFGFSRDDAGKFLNDYYEKKIFESDPFARVDQNGVGKLMQIAVELGKKTRPNIKLGICGEHGGDPSSIEFCHRIGLNYVSCSPFRVPIARLAAAQAALKNRK
ncbi:MAG: pyruvate, phosphate dikinase [Clostridiales bacterium]|nr:pyruvate, phosphate dikinase [Clostridiales bacterium]MDD7687887.1 pyruvate, phosphate dikinase [Clostridiales bacterium]MDY2597866.1 pyruvate, phosphate dikinase [Eubacteriales bacterium]